ncbi:hypothetical protein SHIRM173S_05177 [Streptomyces hirsutus]
MRDVHEGDADLGLDAFELQLHLTAQFQVEGAERLVEQQYLRVVDQGAGHGDPLLLAAGELVRLLVGLLAELDEFQHLAHLLLHAPDAAPAQTEGDVLEDVEVREEGEDWKTVFTGRLYGGSAVTSWSPRRTVPAVGSSRRRSSEGGGPAAAGRAEQREEGTLGHGQVEGVDGGERAGLAEAGEADVPAGRPCRASSLRSRHAPVSFANFASNAVSSSALRERKERDLACMAWSGRISGLFAASSSIFASSSFTPSTGQTKLM